MWQTAQWLVIYPLDRVYLPFDQLGLKIQKDYNIVVLAMKALLVNKYQKIK